MRVRVRFRSAAQVGEAPREGSAAPLPVTCATAVLTAMLVLPLILAVATGIVFLVRFLHG